MASYQCVWKSANVVPIHKSGERPLAENYRPVSLTSMLTKSLERIIHKHIMKFLTHHILLSESQHAFREARSWVTQILQLLHSWFSSLEKGNSFNVIFLDFAKAFERVSHYHLFYRLQCNGNRGRLLSWFHDYVRPYTKSHYWRLFIRLDGGVLRCSSREYTGATSFPPVHKWLSPKC